MFPPNLLECLYLLCFTSETLGLCMVNGNCDLKNTQKLDIPAFYMSRTPTYERCCNLCASVEKCRSVNYDHDTYLCQLLATTEGGIGLTASPSDTHGTFVKSAKKELGNLCRSRPCQQHEICVTTKSGGGYICLLGGTCSHAPAIPNTSSHLDFVSPSTGQATYTCETGYHQLSGSGVSTCSLTGGWTPPTLLCDRIDCGSPLTLPSMQTGVFASTRYLDQVNYTCQVGYTRTVGEGTSVCLHTGQWSSPSLQCQVVDCGSPPLVTNMDLGTVVSTEYLGQVTLTCSPGFESNGADGTIECQGDGSWSTPLMICQRRDCNVPTSIDKMTYDVTSTLYESEAEYKCDVGFKTKSGNGFSNCRADGLWETPTLICEVVDCGPPPYITNLTVSNVPSTLYSSAVDYTCDLGYHPVGGTGSSVCQPDGTWSTPSLQCTLVDCGPPRMDNGYELVSVGGTVYNSSAEYRCLLGKVSTTPGVSVCLDTGQWSDLIMNCVDVPGLLFTLKSSSPSPQLQCTTRASTQGTAPSVACEAGEVMTGCSAITVAEGTKSRGALLSAPKCVASADALIVAVARCCTMTDLQCEYIKQTDQTAVCVKDFQLTDCSCGAQQYNTRHCRLSHTNHSCAPQPVAASNYISFYYALCCTSPRLSCYQKPGVSSASGNMTVECEAGEIMTGCSGYNYDTNIQGAEIQDISGKDTCVVKPGASNITTLTGYANCCTVL